MKKTMSILMLLIIAALISISCKSAPPSTDELNQAQAKANTAKQRAIDFESPAYFPSEWEVIEVRYNAAAEMPLSDVAEVKAATDEYNALADSYDEIFKKTIPLYAQAREDEINSIREALISTSFTQQFPEYLKNADDITLSALEKYEAEDYYGAKETAAKAQEEYETLSRGAAAYVARREIVDRNFSAYDENNFAKADEVAKMAIDLYNAGNKEAAIQMADEALLRYNLVLSNGWTNYAAERRTSVLAERELAIAERANIASREIFRDAETFYQQAEENITLENFNDAALQYTEAEALYAISRQDTAERRRRAEEAIRMAEEKIIESDEAAQEAERIIEGGSR